ncbi:hypothetical protein [Scytonema sp. HK-05]
MLCVCVRHALRLQAIAFATAPNRDWAVFPLRSAQSPLIQCRET